MAEIKKRSAEERGRIDEARGPFTTRDEAAAVDPKAEGYSLTPVTRPDGTVTFTWAVSGDRAILAVARADGYKAGSTKPVDRNRLTEQFNRLSPEDQKALVAAWTTAAEDKADKSKGKKK